MNITQTIFISTIYKIQKKKTTIRLNKKYKILNNSLNKKLGSKLIGIKKIKINSGSLNKSSTNKNNSG